MQDSIYVKGKACPDRFKKIMFDGLKKVRIKEVKDWKRKKRIKRFLFLEIDLDLKDEKTTYDRSALLLWVYIMRKDKTKGEIFKFKIREPKHHIFWLKNTHDAYCIDQEMKRCAHLCDISQSSRYEEGLIRGGVPASWVVSVMLFLLL